MSEQVQDVVESTVEPFVAENGAKFREFTEPRLRDLEHWSDRVVTPAVQTTIAKMQPHLQGLQQWTDNVVVPAVQRRAGDLQEWSDRVVVPVVAEGIGCGWFRVS